VKTLSTTVGLIAGVVLLVPLVLAGGLIALVALPALSLARCVRSSPVARRRETAATVVALGPAAVEQGLEALGQRAV
jgi:hypothetical protein